MSVRMKDPRSGQGRPSAKWLYAKLLVMGAALVAVIYAIQKLKAGF